MAITAFHHVQLAMPPGKEDDARRFYCDVLGFEELPKSENLRKRGGAWFRSGAAEVHVGVEQDFRPAKNAHPALLVTGLGALAERCRAAGFETKTDEALTGYNRFSITDPFGNRIEFLEPDGTNTARGFHMAEVVQEFSVLVRGNRVRAFAEQRGNVWIGYLEFIGPGGTRKTGEETSQPNREAVVYWASGLEPIYLEGALGRAK